jgi:4-hydroxyphenylpyruvate dioxygenase
MAEDLFPIRRIDHISFVVGNARQSAYFYRNAFGFDITAYAGLETGEKDEAGYVLRQGDVRFILKSPLSASNPDNERILRHGDCVKDVAWEVDDVALAYQTATSRGARGLVEPHFIEDEHGVIEIAAIAAYGDLRHSLINRDRYKGIFLPGFKPIENWRYSHRPAPDAGIKSVDHVVGNVELGQMNEWVRFYEDVLGFKQIITFDDKDISTEYSALMSKVVAGGNGRIKMPINEPAEGLRKSQIDEYLEFYGGPGVQHIALETDDIIRTVRTMMDNDVTFLKVPSTYYDDLPSRVGAIAEDFQTVADLGILVDRDDEGYLLQIFTQPVEDRPTLFFELIQRHGSRSFGKGNFKALFEAIEREQAKRGTL